MTSGNDGQTGPTGATGNGIASITKTGTSGLVDTYTITYTNGNTTTFTVTNGEDGEVTETELEELRQQVKDLEANQITNEPETATELYINDSADARFRKLIPIGRTTQESTTGKNKIDYKMINTQYTLKDNGYYLIVFPSNETILSNQFEENTQYTLSVNGYGHKGSSSKTNGKFIFEYTDGTSSTLAIRGESPSNFSLTSTSGKTISDIKLTWGSESYTYLKDLQLEKSSIATDYEPYTGGEAAPNPNYEMPIKNTGDNGSVNEKVQNKNLFDKDNTTYRDGYVLNDSGVETANSTYGYTNTFVDVLGNTQYTIQGNLATSSSSSRIYYYDEDEVFISRSEAIANDNFPKTFTTPANCKKIRFQYVRSTYDASTVMLEQGSTATPYQTHEEQTLSFPLAQGQKLYEDGTIIDGKVVNEWGEYVFTGNETFTRDKELTNSYRFYTPSNTIPNSISGTSRSTHFKNSTVNNISNVDDQALTVINQNQITLRINKTLASTAQELKDLLAEWYANGNPLRVQFHRVTPVEEDFTEEQKQAWEEIKKARTYKPVTHISSTDETPANVEAEYVVDLKTYIDNK